MYCSTGLESLESGVFGNNGIIKARGADTFTITVASLLNTDGSVLLFVWLALLLRN